jgi:transposase
MPAPFARFATSSFLIRALIILAHVVGCDETPIRVGPGPRKRYLLVACTRLCTYYLLGDRTVATFAAFVLPDLDGVVVVHDRYQNYDSFGGLINAASTARDQVLTAVAGDIAAPLEHAFRHGVILGLGQLLRREDRGQLKHRALLDALRDRHDDILRFTTDLRIPPTSNDADYGTCGRRKPGRKSLAGSAARKLPGTGSRSAVTSSTAGKHGADVLTALRDAITGQPWMLPRVTARLRGCSQAWTIPG